MPFPPNAYLIGTAKAGTTYLAALLDQQSGICVASPKEPHYFTKNYSRGLDWYRTCFSDPDTPVLLDASTSYSAAPIERKDPPVKGDSAHPLMGVPARIRKLSPEARFLYCLRDPVERTYSLYWHRVRVGAEHRSFRHVIREDPEYLDRASNYLGQIHVYLESYSLERFLFLRFEDIRNDPVTTVQECARFLGVDLDQPVDTDRAGTHPSFQPGVFLRIMNATQRHFPGLRLGYSKLRQFIPTSWQESLRNRLSRPIPPLNEEDRKLLEAHFLPMVKPLEELTGLSLSHWCGGDARPDTSGAAAPDQNK